MIRILITDRKYFCIENYFSKYLNQPVFFKTFEKILRNLSLETKASYLSSQTSSL